MSWLPHGHRVGDPRGDGVADGGVQYVVGVPAQAHVRHRRLRRVARHPVDARHHLLRGALARVVEHPDRDDLGLFGDPVRGARDRTGDMGAVAVVVLGAHVVVDGVVAVGSAPAEVLVRDVDAGVDDVRGDALPGRVRVGVGGVQRETPLVDPGQTPGGRVRLGGVELQRPVLRHLGDGRVRGEPPGLPLRQLCGVPVQRGVVRAADLSAGAFDHAPAPRGTGRRAGGVEEDEVARGDGSRRARVADGPLRRTRRRGPGVQPERERGGQREGGAAAPP